VESLLLLISLGSVVTVQAQDMPVPPELQAAIFRKIFEHDRNLAVGTSPRLLIAFSADYSQLKNRLVRAFEGVGIKPSAEPDDHIMNISQVDVLYLATQRKSFRQLCEQNSVLSITGFPSLVENGEVAIGLTATENKPKIVIHRKQLKAEGHELANTLLQLAKLVD